MLHLRHRLTVLVLLASTPAFASTSGEAAAGQGSLASPAPAARDRYGDALPPHAVIRIGSTRLRHETPLRGLAVAPSGAVAATLGDDQVRMWSIPGGELFFAVPFGRSPVTALSFSPSGRHLALGRADGQVNLWDARDGRPRAVVEAHPGGVTAVAYALDGKSLISAGADGRVAFRDPATLSVEREVPAHRGAVRALVWSPDGSVLATGGDDKRIRLWKPDGTALIELPGHAGSVTSLCFSPGGDRLLSGSTESTGLASQLPASAAGKSAR